MKRYGVCPITVLTWPGPMKPSTIMPGESSTALIVGMMAVRLAEPVQQVRCQHGDIAGPLA